MAKKNLSLAIVTAISFPEGLAGANRIISYSKGLVELGNEVTVLTSNSPQSKAAKNTFHGIKHCSYGKTGTQGGSGVKAKISAVLRLIIALWKNREGFDMVLIVSNSAVLILLTFLACKFSKLPYLQEKSEFPFVLKNKGIFGKAYASIYTKYIYRLFDGMIIMTYPLEEYFRERTKKGCRKIIIPMTVEPERFDCKNSDASMGNYIAYCGYMGGNKDGVENLIRSFGLIEKKYSDLELLLIGTAEIDELNKQKELVRSLGLNNVHFQGRVNRDQMPSLLCGAKILLLARPSSLQSTGGFPTKLGEYLSTGKPTIVTKVGDIPRYLIDGDNAFLVEPDDNAAFALKIEFVLNNYDEALNVAQKGRRLTEEIFNYKIQSERIHFFLRELLIEANI